MYCEFYGFTEKPFHITPNPRFLFLSKIHKEALAHLLYGIDNHVGFVELTGEVGTGKTTTLRTLLGQLGEGRYRTALIFNPCLSALELLRSINREFGLPAEGLGNGELIEELNRFLLEENHQGRTVVLVIDEAQNLTPQVLEQIRLISNLETESDKLIQIVLAGQPELLQVMERPELRQLAQRMAVRYHLRSLDYADTRAYIAHRLTVAGGRGVAAFTEAACKRIYRYSGGSPRLINIACDRALVVGYGDGTWKISGRQAAAAIGELRGTRSPASRRTRLLAAVAAIALIVGLVGLFLARQTRIPVAARPAVPAAASAAPATAAPPAAAPAQPLWQEAPTRPLPAVNALAGLWQVAPLPGDKAGQSTSVRQLANRAGLAVLPANGSLDRLLRHDLPILAVVTPPGSQERRYLAIIAADRETVTVAPALAGQTVIPRHQLAQVWQRRGFLLWKNLQDIPTGLAHGAAGVAVLRLQILLKGAGTLSGEPTGVFDDITEDAIKTFQKRQGLTPDGRPGAQTLLLLYRHGSTFPVPRLGNPKERA
jgi:general secretion pathway protein A